MSVEAGAAKMGFPEAVVGGWVGFKNYRDTPISAPCLALTVLILSCLQVGTVEGWLRKRYKAPLWIPPPFPASNVRLFGESGPALSFFLSFLSPPATSVPPFPRGGGGGGGRQAGEIFPPSFCLSLGPTSVFPFRLPFLPGLRRCPHSRKWPQRGFCLHVPLPLSELPSLLRNIPEAGSVSPSSPASNSPRWSGTRLWQP